MLARNQQEALLGMQVRVVVSILLLLLLLLVVVAAVAIFFLLAMAAAFIYDFGGVDDADDYFGHRQG